MPLPRLLIMASTLASSILLAGCDNPEGSSSGEIVFKGGASEARAGSMPSPHAASEIKRPASFVVDRQRLPGDTHVPRGKSRLEVNKWLGKWVSEDGSSLELLSNNDPTAGSAYLVVLKMKSKLSLSSGFFVADADDNALLVKAGSRLIYFDRKDQPDRHATCLTEPMGQSFCR